MLVLLKRRLLVSKVENPKPVAESRPFSQTTRKIPWQSRKELNLWLAASCGMYFHGFQCTWNQNVRFHRRNWCKCKRRFGRWKISTLVSAECELSVDHITGHPVAWRRVGVATFGLRSAPATAWTQWCISANKGFPKLASVTKFSPLPEQNDDLRFCLPCRYLPAKSVNGDASGRPYQRIVHRRRDMRTPIPYRTRGTVPRPASGHSCRPTSLQWRTRRRAFFFASSLSRSLQQRWPLRWGPARCSRDVTDEHAIRARPSCCGFWNLVNAQA